MVIDTDEMFDKLMSQIINTSYKQVAQDLGYASCSNIRHWVKNGEIPAKAWKQVSEYLNHTCRDNTQRLPSSEV